MTRMVCALTLLATSVVNGADRLVIVPTEGGECHLQLPRDVLSRHEATPMKRQTVPFVSLPTILAGLALAAAVILAGLILSRKPSSRLVTGAFACVVAGMLFVNSSCSPHPSPIEDNTYLRDLHALRRQTSAPFRSTQPPAINADGTLSGEMLLEEGPLGDAVRLVIDQETLQGLKEK